MSKKNIYGGNFFPYDPADPLFSIAAAGANMLVGYGLKWASRKVAGMMGLSDISVEKQIALNRSRLLLHKQEADFEATKIAREKQLRILDLKIQEKQLYIEERKQRLETVQAEKAQLTPTTVMGVISGALELQPDAHGLTGASDQLELYEEWLESWRESKIAAIMGKRGSGKSVLIGKIAEYLNAKYRMSISWVGLPPSARQFLPKWINMVETVEQCPPNSFVVTDEAGVNYLSLAFNTDKNKLLRMQLMIARHKNCSMAFAVQSSRDMDASIVRLADCFIFKEPSLHQPLCERSDMQSMAKKAAVVFAQIPKDERRQAAYVFDSSFEGVIKSALPTFWSEDLSHIYANLDLNKMQSDAIRRNVLQRVSTQETKLLGMASLDKNILELKRQGNGIEKIAKTLGISTYQVRKVLPKED